MQTLLPGITAERVPTSRLTTAVLSVTGRAGHPVLFVHGNVSSSLFWQPTMLALPEGFRPLAVDLRGFGETDPEPVDATRGLGDYADDLAAVIEALGLTSVHLVGWSMGGGVVLQYLTQRPGTHRAASVTLVAPVSPFGFGGTRGPDGTLCDPSGAGSGAGSANPDFVERLAGRDRTADKPTSPRQVLLAHYVKPPFVPAELDIFVESMLSTRIGDSGSPAWTRWSRSRRSCGCAARTTSSCPTPRCTTSPTWARSGPCPAGQGLTPGRRSRWWRRPVPCSTATPRLAAGTAKQSSRTPGTARTSTRPSGSAPRWLSTWRQVSVSCSVAAWAAAKIQVEATAARGPRSTAVIPAPCGPGRSSSTRSTPRSPTRTRPRCRSPR